MVRHFIVVQGHTVVAEEFVLDISHYLGILVDFCIYPDSAPVSIIDNFAINHDRHSRLHYICRCRESLLNLFGLVFFVIIGLILMAIATFILFEYNTKTILSSLIIIVMQPAGWFLYLEQLSPRLNLEELSPRLNLEALTSRLMKHSSC
jgi:hypothetical protein